MLIDSKEWKKLNKNSFFEIQYKKLKKLKKEINEEPDKFPFLRKNNNKEVFKTLSESKNKFRGVDKILLIGIGGSSLGAKALISVCNNKKIIFLENLDIATINTCFEENKKYKLGLLIISKSGETLEVLCLFDIIIRLFKKNIDLKNKSLIITDKKKSTLRNIAEKYNIEVIDHDNNIGGRFSCFSITGLLPLQLAGVNSIKLKKIVDANFKKNLVNDNYNINNSIISLSGIIKKKKYVGHVFLVYIDSFKNIGLWYRQLWTESLGKEGMGLHFITAEGSTDQHSQLQMWLEGPKNLIFTIVMAKVRRFDRKVLDKKNILPGYLKGQSTGEILNIMAKSTAVELKKVGYPVRIISLQDNYLESAVQLMTTLLLEVALVGKMISINPFNQPAVEKVKTRTRKILNKNV